MALLVSNPKHQTLELHLEKSGKFVPDQDFHMIQIQVNKNGMLGANLTDLSITGKDNLNATYILNENSYSQVFLDELDSIKNLKRIDAFENSDKSFREAFEQLNQSIATQNEKEAREFGNQCIEIAIDNSARTPFWVGQLIAVYAVLSQDHIINKNFNKAIFHATKAVDAAEESDLLIEDRDNYYKFLAQSLMLRGILFSTQNVCENAIDDFSQAAESYRYAKDYILAIEAYRMSAYGFQQLGDFNGIRRQLMPALELGKELPTEIIKSTTFAGVLKMLLGLNDLQWIQGKDIEDLGLLHYGADWATEIRNWKNPNTLEFIH